MAVFRLDREVSPVRFVDPGDSQNALVVQSEPGDVSWQRELHPFTEESVGDCCWVGVGREVEVPVVPGCHVDGCWDWADKLWGD